MGSIDKRIVRVKIGYAGGDTSFRAFEPDVSAFLKAVENSKKEWVIVPTEIGGSVRVRLGEIVTIETAPYDEEYAKLPGFTVQDLADVTGRNYTKVYREVRKLELNRPFDSSRRLLCTEKNFNLLGLKPEEIKKLREIESSRIGLGRGED